MYSTRNLIPWGAHAPECSVPLERRVVKEDSPIAKAAVAVYPPKNSHTKYAKGCVAVLVDRMLGKAVISTSAIDEKSLLDGFWIAAQNNTVRLPRNCDGPMFTMQRNKKHYHCLFNYNSDTQLAILRIFAFDSYFKLGEPHSWFEIGRYCIHGDDCWLEKSTGELIPNQGRALHLNYINNDILQSISWNVEARTFVDSWNRSYHGKTIDKLVPDDIKAAMSLPDASHFNMTAKCYNRYQVFGEKEYHDWCLVFDNKRMYKFRYNCNLNKWVSTHQAVPKYFDFYKVGKTNTVLDIFPYNHIDGYNLELGLKHPDLAKYSMTFIFDQRHGQPENIHTVKELFGTDGKMLVNAINSSVHDKPCNMPVVLHWPIVYHIAESFKNATTHGVDAQTAIEYAVFTGLNWQVRMFAATEFAKDSNFVRYIVRLKQANFTQWHDLAEYYREYRQSANKWEDVLVERGFKPAPKYFPERIKPSRVVDTISKAKRSAKEWHDYCYNLENTEIDSKISAVAKSKLVNSLTSYATKEYFFDVPHNSMDLVKEGTALDHCVGRMGYNRKIAIGDSIILFLRKKAEPDKPFYTIELCPDMNGENWFMHQCYTFHDGIEKTTSCRAFIDAWLKKNSIPNLAIY